jgi:TolA-binding protein
MLMRVHARPIASALPLRIALLVLWTLLGGAARAQLPAAKAMQAYNMAQMDMKSKKYDAAIKGFESAINVLGPLVREEPRYRPAVEFSTYNIPICQLQKKDLDEAVNGFRKYITNYPDGQFFRVAHVLWADIRASQGKWKEVIDVVFKVKDDRALTAQERLVIFQLWGEAHFNLEQYKEALEPLQWVFRNGPTMNTRIEAAVLLAVCLTRLGEFDKLYEFVPKLYKTSAKFDLRLQMALLEEGDTKYDDGEVTRALLLYRLVYYKSQLVTELNKKITEAKRQHAILTRREADDPQLGTQARQLERILQTLDEQLKQLAEIPDYDAQLTIRLANCYFDLDRHLEALKLYRSIYDDNPSHPLAQQALYRAFTAAFAMRDIERALAEAYHALDAFPGGEFWETLTVNVAIIHNERKEYEKCIAICERALKVKPDHGLADNMVYLKGYSQFMLSRLEAAMTTFELIFEKYPKSSFLQPAQYWHALGFLYIPIYTPAREEFQEFLSRYTIGALVEDASYRVGVALYGEGKFGEVADVMRRFIGKYPDSILKSEAHAMLADVLASDGQLDEAVENYRLALPPAVNMVQVDYAMMQHARTLELEQKYEDIIALWRQYLITYSEMANYTEALYWIGNSQRNLGRLEEALNTFYEGIVKYGDDARGYGVDSMVMDLKAEFNELPDITASDFQASTEDADRVLMVSNLRDRLRQELAAAGQARKQTLQLRLATLFAETSRDVAVRQSMANTVMTDANIPRSAPVTLAFMGREAVQRNNLAFANKVYDYFLEEHRNSDLVLEALRGKAETLLKQNQTEAAAGLLQELVNRFAMSEQAAWAFLRLGEIELQRNNLAAAQTAFETLLSVKEWRGESWAEALYQLGLVHMARKEWDEAFVIFERNYVLYSGFPRWAARSFLKAAECQERTQRPAEAVKVLEMMLQTELVNEQAEAAEARKRLAELKPS